MTEPVYRRRLDTYGADSGEGGFDGMHTELVEEAKVLLQGRTNPSQARPGQGAGMVVICLLLLLGVLVETIAINNSYYMLGIYLIERS